MKTMKKLQKPMALILALVMMALMIPATVITSSAADENVSTTQRPYSQVTDFTALETLPSEWTTRVGEPEFIDGIKLQGTAHESIETSIPSEVQDFTITFEFKYGYAESGNNEEKRLRIYGTDSNTSSYTDIRNSKSATSGNGFFANPGSAVDPLGVEGAYYEDGSSYPLWGSDGSSVPQEHKDLTIAVQKEGVWVTAKIEVVDRIYKSITLTTESGHYMKVIPTETFTFGDTIGFGNPYTDDIQAVFIKSIAIKETYEEIGLGENGATQAYLQGRVNAENADAMDIRVLVAVDAEMFATLNGNFDLIVTFKLNGAEVASQTFAVVNRYTSVLAAGKLVLAAENAVVCGCTITGVPNGEWDEVVVEFDAPDTELDYNVGGELSVLQSEFGA